MSSLPTGRRLGIDVGSVRVGIALSDPLGMLATPLTTVGAEEALPKIVEIIEQDGIKVIYVGWPLHLSGSEGQSTQLVSNFLAALSSKTDVTIQLIDERLTSTQAAKFGAKGSDVDSFAASLILERALLEENQSQTLAGKHYETP